MNEEEKAVEKLAYEELKSDGFDPFCSGHMPPSLARMIGVKTHCWQKRFVS